MKRLGSVLLRRGFRTDVKTYNQIYSRSITPGTREEFWKEEARKLNWNSFPKNILDLTKPLFPRWYSDGEINACYNCVDRHVQEGRGEQLALVYDSPVTDTKTKLTYRELLDAVEKFAGILKETCSVRAGDRVIIYMPMIPEAIVAMLACARLGAPHSVVFGGFASKELAIRIDDAKAKVIVSATCGVEPTRVVHYEPLLKGALELCKFRPESIIMKHRVPTKMRKDLPDKTASTSSWGIEVFDWDEEMKKAKKAFCTFVPSTSPLYILYTSGSTGTPKGIVRDTGGYCTAMSYSMNNFMKSGKGDVYFAASDIGWVVGHSYIVYGPLISGCTTILYEGKPVGTPDATAFWRLVDEYKINSLFTAPTALRAIRRADPNGELIQKFDFSTLRGLFLAGERADPETVSFYSKALSNQAKREVPIVDCFWQTETGWPVCGIQDTVRGVLPGSTAKPLPGFDVQILEEKEDSAPNPVPKQMKANEIGMICIKNPLPPGALLTVYNNDQRYVSGYMNPHPGYYTTGDLGFIDEQGYVTVMTRNDDLINVAGHRLSTGTLEQAISGHADVAEVACVGAKDSLKGEVCVGFIVLHSNVDVDARGDKIEKECIARVREFVGPVASFHNCYVVSQLPKTKSGKILRTIIRRILNGETNWIEKVPGTVEDIRVLHTIEEVVKKRWTPQ